MRDISARELKGQHPLDDRIFRPAFRLLRQPR